MNDIFEYKVIIDDSPSLSQYDELLNRFSNWKKFQRDIKLTSLFEDKKIQYNIEDIHNVYGYFGKIDSTIDRCLIIKSMSFIIKSEIVKELTIKIQINNADYRGLKLISMIQSGTIFEMKQRIINDKVIFFYIEDTSI